MSGSSLWINQLVFDTSLFVKCAIRLCFLQVYFTVGTKRLLVLLSSLYFRIFCTSNGTVAGFESRLRPSILAVTY